MSLNLGSNQITPIQKHNVINNLPNKTIIPNQNQQVITPTSEPINVIIPGTSGRTFSSSPIEVNIDASFLIYGETYQVVADRIYYSANYRSSTYSSISINTQWVAGEDKEIPFTIVSTGSNDGTTTKVTLSKNKIRIYVTSVYGGDMGANGNNGNIAFTYLGNYDGIDQVTVQPIPSDYIIPEGTLTISAPGIINAASYANVSIPGITTPTWNTATITSNIGKINYSINLPSGFKSTSQTFTSSITLPSITGTTIIPSETSQTITLSYKWTLGSIIVDAIPNTVAAYKKVFDKTVNDDDLNIVLSGVSSIGQNQFYNCLNITTLSNSTISYINSAGFSNCKNLTTINLPNLQTTGFYPFQGCTKITTISLPNLSRVANGLISNTSYISSIELPKLVDVTNHYFLYNCPNLTYVSLPLILSFNGTCNLANLSNLTSITLPACLSIAGTQTFMNDFNLSLIDLPQVSLIGPATFQNCYNLVNLSVPKLSVISGASTFSSCSQLSTISFPMLTKISGSRTFINCINLISLYFMSNSMVTLTSSDIFSNTPFINSALTGAFGSIYVPNSLLNTYKTNSMWSWYSDRFVGV